MWLYQVMATSNDYATYGDVCDARICLSFSTSNANNSDRTPESRLRRHVTAILADAVKRAAPMQLTLETLSAVTDVVTKTVDVRRR